VIYMRAGYIAVLGTLFLYACLLSWRKHRLTQAVARAEASRAASHRAPQTSAVQAPAVQAPAVQASAGEMTTGETPWGLAGTALVDATPAPDRPPDGVPVVRLEVPPEVGR
jgi:hypothetical protein